MCNLYFNIIKINNHLVITKWLGILKCYAWQNIMYFRHFFKFLFQYTVHFELCQDNIIQKYAITIKFAVICNHDVILGTFKLLEYVKTSNWRKSQKCKK